ncbi:MAG TPA: desulfoferrodoxin [Rectinemataceae bacterium]|nr:desulfoferrodoxin [Rectinemataceae bacterium]
MSERLQVYKCESCGAMVQMLHASGCEPACCGAPMKLMAENSVDAAKEKHVPVIERIAGGYKVSVGSVPHPMENDHYIEWIELLAGTGVGRELSLRQFLMPGDKPEAVFHVEAKTVGAREYCNKHGLWKA